MALASRKTIQLLIILFGLVSFVSGNAVATKRVALVIGNSDYLNASSLTNPTNDADAMTRMLKDIGFEVRKVKNVGYTQMRLALRLFSSKAANADIALIFYAGHGMEVDKHNYLLPADVTLASDRDIDFEAVPLDLVTQAAGGAKILSLVLLDACRNNPFAASMKRTIATRSIGRGLALVEPTAGTLVSFAAKEGTVAEDGRGKNSPYTSALMKHLREPGLEINFLFRKVRDAVLKETRGSQEPFTYGSLPGKRLYLIQPESVKENQPEKKQEKIANKQTPVKSNLLNNQLQTSQAERAFGLISKSENLSLLNAFVKKYPDSFHASIITVRIGELNTRKIKVEAEKQKAISEPGINNRLAKLKEAERKWALLKTSKDLGALKQFATDYSDTAFRSVAQSRIELLGELALLEETKKQASKNNLNSGEARIQSAIDQWKQLKTSRNLKDLSDFAEKYPELVYANLAIARVEELRNAIKKRQVIEAQKKLDDEAIRAWAGLKNSLNEQKLRAFLRKFSTTRFETLANNRLAYLNSSAGRSDARWRNIAWSTNITVLKEFIEEFPTSPRTTAASNRIGELAVNEANAKYEKKRYSEAFRLLKTALDIGNKDAAFRLAYLYDVGQGVKKNPREAVRLYKLAINNNANDHGSMSNLAIAYDEGKGVSKDRKKAASLVYSALVLKSNFLLKEMTNKATTWSKQFRIELQRKMRQEGYYKGAIDGSFGPASIAAIKKVAGK